MHTKLAPFLSLALVAAMPVFDCHKQVSAMKIASIADQSEDGKTDIILIAPGVNETIAADNDWIAHHQPEVGGYVVVYADGYTSYSPAEPFETGYTLREPREPGVSGQVSERDGKFGFDVALKCLKQGLAVERSGWNGKGMFVYLVPPNSYPAQTEIAKRYFGENSLVPYGAYLALKGVDGTVNTWVPSVSDCLAEDWQMLA